MSEPTPDIFEKLKRNPTFNHDQVIARAILRQFGLRGKKNHNRIIRYCRQSELIDEDDDLLEAALAILRMGSTRLSMFAQRFGNYRSVSPDFALLPNYVTLYPEYDGNPLVVFQRTSDWVNVVYALKIEFAGHAPLPMWVHEYSGLSGSVWLVSQRLEAFLGDAPDDAAARLEEMIDV